MERDPRDAEIERLVRQLTLLVRRSRKVARTLAAQVHPEVDAGAYAVLLLIADAGGLRLVDVAEYKRRQSAPGVKISATPWLFSSAASSSGIVPPTTTSTSSAPFSFNPSRMRGTSVMCAPERIEIPTASASSWIAVSTICSGV